MALSVLPITGRKSYISGNRDVVMRTITFDSSYPTGGEALTPADFGLKVLDEVRPHGSFRAAANTSAIEVSYDYTNQKLIAFWGNAGTASVQPEVTNTTDLSTYSGRVTAVGQ
ncbi:MAG TPA: hypothetical protein VE645_19210 [Pseudonocardiaceae bacterium]|jgi:hypothetical protein|nr:hypothetical protein [Pseudonocardiaceae bacterium]